MSKYRKKAVVVEAFEAFIWTGDKNQTEDPEWIVKAIKNGDVRIEKRSGELIMFINTKEHGTLAAKPGSYIMLNAKNEILPCQSDIFEMTFDIVEEIDWNNAVKHMKELTEAYAECGSAGLFGLGIMTGFKSRYDSGERTKLLYDEIMESH